MILAVRPSIRCHCLSQPSVNAQRRRAFHCILPRLGHERLRALLQIDWDEAKLQHGRFCVRSGVDEALDELRRKYGGLSSFLVRKTDRHDCYLLSSSPVPPNAVQCRRRDLDRLDSRSPVFSLDSILPTARLPRRHLARGARRRSRSVRRAGLGVSGAPSQSIVCQLSAIHLCILTPDVCSS